MIYFLSCACSALRLHASLGVCGFGVVFLGHVGSIGGCVVGWLLRSLVIQYPLTTLCGLDYVNNIICC
jgi:ABC-type glucose/galactose transport system permease subunit